MGDPRRKILLRGVGWRFAAQIVVDGIAHAPSHVHQSDTITCKMAAGCANALDGWRLGAASFVSPVKR